MVGNLEIEVGCVVGDVLGMQVVFGIELFVEFGFDVGQGDVVCQLFVQEIFEVVYFEEEVFGVVDFWGGIGDD